MSSSKTTPLHLPVLILLVVLLLSTMSDAQSPSDDGDAWVDNSSNVSPSMAIVVIVLVLGFFITGCIFIYIQQCTDTTSSSTVTPTTALMRNNNASPGLPQTIIETFPIFPFSDVKHHKIGKGALECAVCLSDFQDDDETLRLLPKCNHVFHSECIDTWLVAHTTCPVCRDNLAEVVPDSDDKLANSNSIHLSTDDVRVTIPGRLPRSHSTGHSLNQLGEDHERFTLRIPAEVRRHIIDRTMMKRATSMVALPRQSSSRRGYRGGGGEGSGSSRYGRLFGRSFIMRVASLRSTAAAKVVAEGGGPTTEFKVGSTQLPV